MENKNSSERRRPAKATLETLSFGGHRIPLAPHELDALREALARHTERTGTAYGFIHGLLHGV